MLRPGRTHGVHKGHREATTHCSRAARFPVVVSVHLLGTGCVVSDTSEKASDGPPLERGGGRRLTCSDAVALVCWHCLRSSSCPLLAWYKARVIAFMACLAFGGGFWWLLGIAIGGVLRGGQSQRKLEDTATCWNVGIPPSSTSTALRKAT